MTEENETAASGSSLLVKVIIVTMSVLVLIGGILSTGYSIEASRSQSLSSITGGMAAADLSEVVVPLLSGHDGKVNVLIAGAADCPHCQHFMKTDYAHLRAFAKSRGLGVSYMPMALSAIGVGVAATEACALRSTGVLLSKEAAVLAGYDATPGIVTAVLKAKASGRVSRITDVYSLFKPLDRKISSSPLDESCFTSQFSSIASAEYRFQKTFGLVGTPTFYYLKDGKVQNIVGDTDLAPLYKALN